MAVGRSKVAQSRSIHLPVITAVRVEGYLLYPGRQGSYQLEHSFLPGMSVIVGVNGQGKTTFLNILYRVLVGPWEQTKADYAQPGRKQHQLTETKPFEYFTSRLAKEDTAASAEVTVQFGDEVLRIRRSLGTALSIEAIWHGDTEIQKPDENKWLSLVTRLSGLSGLYDFYFVVRHFLFFLEDRIPLLWNPYGQFEILRILFLDPALSDRCVELHDEILREDSIYRNLLWQNNQRVERLRELKEELYPENSRERDVIESLAVLRERLSAAELAAEDGVRQVNDALQLIENSEAALFAKQVDFSNAQAGLELAERQYFKQAFPDADEITGMLFGYLLAGDRCLVCGSEKHEAALRIREVLRSRKCPACDSKIEKHKKANNPLDVSKRLKAREDASRRLEVEISSLEEKLQGHRTRLTASILARAETQKVLALIRLRVQRSQNQAGLPHELSALEQETEEVKSSLREKSATLKTLRSEYDTRLSEANEQIEAVAQFILRKFKEYADKFVLEKAILKYELHERILGQSGQSLRFPNFVLWLSSATSANPSERSEESEVSESQREFIDLAFRMALLDVAVSKLGPAMIVIETPEASLDAVFVERAGQMLKAFAEAATNNRVIATSNVNGEAMVGWLLGTIGNKDKYPMKLIRPRLLNLLEEGRETRAYRQEKSTYVRALSKAIYGG